MVKISLWNQKYIPERKNLWLLILKSYSNLLLRPFMIFVRNGFRKHSAYERSSYAWKLTNKTFFQFPEWFVNLRIKQKLGSTTCVIRVIHAYENLSNMQNVLFWGPSVYFSKKKPSKEIQTFITARFTPNHGECFSLTTLFTQGPGFDLLG